MIIKRRLWRRVKNIFLYLGASLLIIVLSLFYIRPLRNIIFLSRLTHSWKSVPTYDLIKMKLVVDEYVKSPYNVTDITHCPSKRPPRVTLSDVPLHSNLMLYPKATPDHEIFRDGKEDLAGFLPAVTHQDRLDFLWMYLVLSKALEDANILFFLVNGSLLGVFRHGGSVPWDSDMDLAINVKDWPFVRRVLSCIDGFKLDTNSTMQWKFLIQGRREFPFIDIFFYTENEDYLWALTKHEFRSLVYEKTLVFPLTEALYEGILVPVPANIERVTRHEFDVEYCYTARKNYKTKLFIKEKYVLCSSLRGVYPLRNLKF